MAPDEGSRSVSELFSIAGKTALITGGSRGIGRMIATGFVEAGARVYISSRKVDACAETAAALGQIGECVALPADLGTESACRRLADALAEREPSLDILVNNAGANWFAPLATHDDAAWDKVLAVNLKGVFHLTRFVLPLLQAAATDDDPARIINVGSVSGIKPDHYDTYAYGASKAGVHLLTRQLARELAPRITVNAIAPGPFPTDMISGDSFADELLASTAMHRWGRQDDAAGAAIFLASRAGSFVTGAVLALDGGMSSVGSY